MRRTEEESENDKSENVQEMDGAFPYDCDGARSRILPVFGFSSRR